MPFFNSPLLWWHKRHFSWYQQKMVNKKFFTYVKEHKKFFFVLESFHVLRALSLRTTKNYHYLNKFIFISSHFHLTIFFCNFFYHNFKPFFATTLHYVDIHSSCDGLNNKLYFHTVHMSLENQVAVFLLPQKKIFIWYEARTLNILWSYQEMFQEQFNMMRLNFFWIFYSEMWIKRISSIDILIFINFIFLTLDITVIIQ